MRSDFIINRSSRVRIWVVVRCFCTAGRGRYARRSPTTYEAENGLAFRKSVGGEDRTMPDDDGSVTAWHPSHNGDVEREDAEHPSWPGGCHRVCGQGPVARSESQGRGISNQEDEKGPVRRSNADLWLPDGGTARRDPPPGMGRTRRPGLGPRLWARGRLWTRARPWLGTTRHPIRSLRRLVVVGTREQ